MMGRSGYAARRLGPAAEVAVLHAITMAFAPSATKRSTIALESSHTCCSVFSPYGAFAESPK